MGYLCNDLAFSIQVLSCFLHQHGKEGFGYKYVDKVTKINN